jgi:hypothetical protein
LKGLLRRCCWKKSRLRILTVLAEQAASGALRAPVTVTYPLEQAPEAFAAFGAGALGKLAVTCSGNSIPALSRKRSDRARHRQPWPGLA